MPHVLACEEVNDCDPIFIKVIDKKNSAGLLQYTFKQMILHEITKFYSQM